VIAQVLITAIGSALAVGLVAGVVWLVTSVL